MSKLKFIDLFSGIGGFHIALSEIGGKCVFASEIDKYAIETYNANFNMNSNFDITNINPVDLPDYNMMCAGFPCQTFSKAGKQNGFQETRGTLFFDMLRLLKFRLDNNNPVKFILFENVRNLISHDNGTTYKIIMKKLSDLGYKTNNKPIIASPHHINIPQLRERTFIVGIHEKYINDKNIDLDFKFSGKRNKTSAYSILEDMENDKFYKITDYEEIVLSAWDEFYKGIKEDVIGFPIWAEFFNDNIIDNDLPKWKRIFIERNKRLYLNNKKFIDNWLKKHNFLKNFVKTHRKFEWQCGKDCSSLWEGIIQFRPSGIRVKRPTEYPALVAMVHIPIIGSRKRRLTPREVANLQSFPKNFVINQVDSQAYKQFGNSVNVDVVKEIAEKLINLV